jgi:predicted transcriptional regulator
VLSFVQEQGPTTRAQVIQRFKRDDEGSVRGILHDLVESGLVFRAGRGYATTYRAASEEELGLSFAADPEQSAQAMTWITIYRQGPLSLGELAEAMGMEEALARPALEALIADGRVEAEDPQAQTLRYTSRRCVLPMGEPSGWEAAVFDHYQSMVAALCTKLRAGDTCSFPQDVIGGSTYSFDVWRGHPYEERVYALLRNQRAQVSALRAEVTRYNKDQAPPQEGGHKVVFYLGQNVIHDGAPLREQDQ